MENICENSRPKNSKASRVSFAKPKKTRALRRSLLQNLIIHNDDDNDSISNASSCSETSDSEWNAIQNKLHETVEFQDQFEDEFESEKDVVRCISFDSPSNPRKSLGTIAQQREELELIKKSMECDDELEFLNASLDAIEENFKTMFGEVTYKRLCAEFAEINQRPPTPINYYQIIENLNLNSIPYIEWANRIEKAILENLK